MIIAKMYGEIYAKKIEHSRCIHDEKCIIIPDHLEKAVKKHWAWYLWCGKL